MTHPLDTFRRLIGQINDLKADLKKQRRRVTPALDVIISYRQIKVIANPLNRLFKSSRYSQQTSIEMYVYALQKLDLLIRELKDCSCTDMAATLQHIYNQLFVLLPKDTPIQHQLFDTDCYQNEHKKVTVVASFLDWLQDYVLLGYQRRDVARRMAFKPLDIVQHSIRLGKAS